MISIDFRSNASASRSNPLPAPFLSIEHFSYMDYSPRWHYFWHQHSRPELIIVTKGQGQMHIGSLITDIAPGHVCLVPPHMLHYYSGGPGSEFCYYSIGFSLQGPDPSLDPWVNSGSGLAIPLSGHLRYLQDSLQILSKHLQQNGFTADALVQSTLYSLLLFVLSQAEQLSIQPLSTGKLAIHDVLAFIAEHYHEKLTLEILCRRFNISPAHMSRLFHQSTGLSPINYIIYYRMTHSLFLLQHTDQSISEITWKMGYQNPAHFTKLFTKYLGFTPTEYRAHCRRQSENFSGTPDLF